MEVLEREMDAIELNGEENEMEPKRRAPLAVQESVKEDQWNKSIEQAVQCE